MKDPTIVCDFCSSPDVRWAYPAQTFTVEVLAAGHPYAPPEACEVWLGSDAGWAACDGCHALIEKSDRGALMERSMTQLGFPPGPMFQGTLREIHDLFFENRTGPALPAEERKA
jgi:hypothetical protein